jgi:hypothetical protein
VTAERGDHHRTEEGELTLQEWCARGDLFRMRVSVIRRTTLDHVQHKDLLTR